MEKPTTTTVEGLRLALEGLGLCTKGLKPELKQRYKKALKKQKESVTTTTKTNEEKVESLEHTNEDKKYFNSSFISQDFRLMLNNVVYNHLTTIFFSMSKQLVKRVGGSRFLTKSLNFQ